MTLMSHLLVAAVLDERGKAYWDCTAPVSFELKECIFFRRSWGRTFPFTGVTDISKILKKCTLQTTTDIFNHRSGDRISTISVMRGFSHVEPELFLFVFILIN